jgi:hypothetical protein
MRGILFRSVGALAALMMASGKSQGDIPMKKKSKATALAFFAVLLSAMALFLPFHAHALAITPIDADFDGFGGYPGWDFGVVLVGQTAVLGVSFNVECTSADVLCSIGNATVDPFFDFHGDLTLTGRITNDLDCRLCGAAETITDTWYFQYNWTPSADTAASMALSEQLIFFYGSTTTGDFIEQRISLNGRGLSPVPIPAAVWLFGSALGFLGWMRRQKTA